MHAILAIDQGTTGTTVLVLDAELRIAGRGYREHPQRFPRPGWVEHDPEAIWRSVVDATGDALDGTGVTPGSIAAVGITNQRETVLAWDAVSGVPLSPTIVWQDRRTAADCEALRAAGRERTIRRVTGLPLDPYFSASKFAWLLEHDGDVASAARAGRLRLGTIDSWLVWRLSGGAAHITDATNAARTMLFDIHACTWSPELLDLFGVDERWLPSIVDSSGKCARTHTDALPGIDAPITGIAGDQQAALFGQMCFEPGQAKATYGTGAFVVVNAGTAPPTTERLIGTVAWSIDHRPTYALEGSVFTAGAAVQWLRDGLGTVDRADEIEALAASVADTGGVTLVPAFAGIAAPHWDADARAALLGMTRGTTRAHIARAVLEAVACRVAELVAAMRDDGVEVGELHVDGGMAANDLLMQMQADMLGIPVTRPTQIETTALGAGYLAALGAGLVTSPNALADAWAVDRVFAPDSSRSEWARETTERFAAATASVRALARSARAPAPARTVHPSG